MTQSSKDIAVADTAKKEALAQLAVIRALKPLSRARRESVIKCLYHILAVEKQVPGILARFGGPQDTEL